MEAGLLDDMYAFDLIKNVWKQAHPVDSSPAARYAFGVASLGSRFFAFGGIDENGC